MFRTNGKRAAAPKSRRKHRARAPSSASVARTVKLQHSDGGTAPPSDRHGGEGSAVAEPLANLTAAKYAEIIKVHEVNKTRRTWAICGAVVAGIGIISWAALKRDGAL